MPDRVLPGLLVAREARGLSVYSLSSLSGFGPSEISLWEAGTPVPARSATGLARALKVPEGLLSMGLPDPQRLFTAPVREPRGDVDWAASGQLMWASLLIEALEPSATFGLLPVVPSLSARSEEELEMASASARVLWGFGEREPTGGLLAALETEGFVFSFTRLGPPSFYSAAAITGQQRPVLLLPESSSPCEARWAAAICLGHLIVNAGLPEVPGGRQDSIATNRAEYFAGALMMPVLSAFPGEFRALGIGDPTVLACRWGVPADALFRRTVALGINALSSSPGGACSCESELLAGLRSRIDALGGPAGASRFVPLLARDVGVLAGYGRG